MKVLIVEDNPDVSEVMSMAFEMRWPDAVLITTGSGKNAVMLAESEHPDLVVLDLGLPDIDGFDVLKDIRLFSNVPVIILTARDDESDIIKGLERGADDYMTKPFRQLELMSRAQAVLRRHHLVSQVSPPACGDLRFGQSLHDLYLGKRQIDLTNTESTLLSHLMRNTGKVVATSTLAELLWGADYPGSHAAVRVYIRRLRKKLEANPEKPDIILTNPGSGYSLHPPG
jgi:two-component system KDP operon response regulator KdpE